MPSKYNNVLYNEAIKKLISVLPLTKVIFARNLKQASSLKVYAICKRQSLVHDYIKTN